MATHPNIELANTVYDAFGNGDMETFFANITDDAVWHLGGNNPLSGTYSGKQEIMAVLGQITERSGGTFQIAEVHDILANDEHVVAMVRNTGERDGKVLDAPTIHISHVRDGKFTELFIVVADQASSDEFWS